jgi:hypothetical protein
MLVSFLEWKLTVPTIVDSRTLSKRLNVAIVHENQAEKKVIGGVGSKNIQKEIRTGMGVFEQQGVIGPNLSKCFKNLKSPTCVESERCFSASGKIVTK